jgi:hypothetical protein
MTRVLAVLFLLATSSGVTEWTPARSRPDAILDGIWQSCKDDTDSGHFGERVYLSYKPDVEIHLGERDEFAIFKGIVEEERDHKSVDNLLAPYFHYDDVPGHGRSWSLPELNWFVSVQAITGSYDLDECRTFAVQIVPLQPGRKLAQ